MIAADANQLPMPDGVFDVVMSYGLLEHFDGDALKVLLAELMRVLRPGGLFIADIIPARLNARALATAMNFSASLAYHLVTGKFSKAMRLHKSYFEHYYENSFGPDTWDEFLREAGLTAVTVKVCRPFPLLAITGKPEARYTAFMRRALPIWQNFENSDSWWARRWGWMYLASGIRPFDGDR